MDLCIAADARFCTPHYRDDHIWELKLGGGEPPAVAICTSFGHRALELRIFPSLALGEQLLRDPASFHRPPQVRLFLPNYLRLEAEPRPGLLMGLEFWVRDSHTLVGRLVLRNAGAERLVPTVAIHGVLRPADGGETMAPREQLGIHFLAGRAGDLAPVLVLAGGAGDQAIYPSLQRALALEPQEERAVLWALAAEGEVEASLAGARGALGLRWEAEIARLELANARLVEIETGDQSWDAALAFAQKALLRAFVGPTRWLPHASFVLGRRPEAGYSPASDGRDHGWSWSGQGAWQALAVMPDLLVVAPELARGVLENFLAAQRADGFIDARPGLGGQRMGALCPPVLATMAWMDFRHTGDRAFLRQAAKSLAPFLELWLSQAYDDDQDGRPHWGNPEQRGFAESPMFAPWRSWGTGGELRFAECPDLAGALYRDLRCMEAIERQLGGAEDAHRWAARAGAVAAGLEAFWSPKHAWLLAMDGQAHVAPPGRRLARARGVERLEIGRTFEQPVRLVVRWFPYRKQQRQVRIFIHGRGRGGRHRVERLRGAALRWHAGVGSAISAKTYLEVERVEIQGLGARDGVEVRIVGLDRLELSAILPLLTDGLPAPRAREMIEKRLLNEAWFWRPFGVSQIPAKDPAYRRARLEGVLAVQMPWLQLAAEALLRHGYRREAAALYARAMQAMLGSLAAHGAFFAGYDPETGAPLGERHSLLGIAPLSLFLEILGVRLLAPDQVVVRGSHPFPWPVRLRWQGVQIESDGQRCRVTFADGRHTEVHGDAYHVVRAS